MITDEQLKAAALELDEALTEQLPEPEEMAYSPRFQRKMKRLLRRKNRSLMENRGFRAAAVLLTVLLLGALALGTGPDAAASFKGLFYEEKEHSYRYVLDGWVTEEYLCAYRLGWIPEGYTLHQSRYRNYDGYAFYTNADKRSIHFFLFDPAEAERESDLSHFFGCGI